jgi:hypothetical protein
MLRGCIIRRHDVGCMLVCSDDDVSELSETVDLICDGKNAESGTRRRFIDDTAMKITVRRRVAQKRVDKTQTKA